jgi:transposase-like protein
VGEPGDVIAASPRSNLRTTPMTKTQVEVITSVQRRRSWSRAEKERIVAAALEPGAVASEVARAAESRRSVKSGG